MHFSVASKSKTKFICTKKDVGLLISGNICIPQQLKFRSIQKSLASGVEMSEQIF